MLLLRTCPALVGRGYGLDWRRVLAGTPSLLLEEWRAFYDLAPWGEERSDLAAGIQIMHAVGCAGGSPKEPRSYMPYLRSEEDQEPQSEEAMKSAFAGVCRQRDAGFRVQGSGFPSSLNPEP